MEYLSVLIAAAGSYAFGAFWYMTLAKPWMAASGVTQEMIKSPDGKQDMTPFIISAIASILVAGMMRHVFEMAEIAGAYKGALAGLGLGLFIVAPWIVTNYAYGMRPRNLSLIDGGYATIGCTIMGLILGFFVG